MIVFCVSAFGAGAAGGADQDTHTTREDDAEVDAGEAEDTAGTGYGGPVELTATGACNCASQSRSGVSAALLLAVALTVAFSRRQP